MYNYYFCLIRRERENDCPKNYHKIVFFRDLKNYHEIVVQKIWYDNNKINDYSITCIDAYMIVIGVTLFTILKKFKYLTVFSQACNILF